MQNKKDINEIHSIMEALLIELTKNNLSMSEELSITINLYFLIAKRWLEILKEKGTPSEMLDGFPSACRQGALIAYDHFLKQIEEK